MQCRVAAVSFTDLNPRCAKRWPNRTASPTDSFECAEVPTDSPAGRQKKQARPHREFKANRNCGRRRGWRPAM